MVDRPSLLILSFSNIPVDGRVLRQVNQFVADYDVTTCSTGEKSHPSVVEHLQLRMGDPVWVRHLQGVALNLKLHTLAYNLSSQVREARHKLRGRRFDAVIVNDIPPMGALPKTISRKQVLLDLHEYWPGIHDDNRRWVKLRKPFFSWQLRKYGPKASVYSTVNSALADLYGENFGFQCDVVTSAADYRPDLEARPVQSPIRYVHSGGARPARRIEAMMRAIDASNSGATLDLYLMGEGTGYYEELQKLEAQLSERVRILPPVPHEQLLSVLNQYDVGLPFLPPTTTNIRNCLPNKFFDYVQAKLAILTGPTPPMVELLEEHDLGVVTTDFSEQSLVAAVNDLAPDDVAVFKENAARASGALSSEPQLAVWRKRISEIVGAGEAQNG